MKMWLEMVFTECGSDSHDFYNSGLKDESYNDEMLTFSFNTKWQLFKTLKLM